MITILVYFLCLVAYIYAMGTCHIPWTLSECGGRRLNHDIEFCCNNQSHRIDSNSCCCVDTISGDEVIHTKDKICCSGQLYKNTNSFGERQGCCGEKVYSVSDPEKVCCHPRIGDSLPQLYHYDPYRYPNWNTSLCCSNRLIDQNTQKCCRGTVNSISGNSSHWHCCNKTAYNDRNHWCNRDNPKDNVILPHFHNFCNGTLYDQRQNTCCNGHLHTYHSREQFKCCGSRIRNLETEQCCDESLSLIISKSRTCCGSFPKGNQHKCVIVSHQEACCGVHKLPTNTYTCCKKKYLVVKTSSSQDECCYNPWNKSGESYMSEKQQCVRGKVEDKASRCVHEKYNENLDLCCDNNLFRGVLGVDKDNKCCGTNFYNNKTQRCCSFRVVNGTQCPGPSKNTACHLCAKNRREVFEKIENGVFDSDICRLKLGYVAEVRRQTVNFENDTMKYVIRRPSRNIFNGRFEIHHKYLLLPWICRKNFSKIIVVTSNPNKKTRELSCFERDLILPYSKRIKQAVKRRKTISCNWY